jgi:hypothetical protein
MTFRESDGRIVPLKSGLQPDGMKPSNIGAGTAARLLHDPDGALPVLRDGTAVLTWLDRSFGPVLWITGTCSLGTVAQIPTS